MPENERTYAIGEIARATGLRTSAVRYYESIGLLAAERDGGRRRYGVRALRQIRLIQTAQQAGFTLGEIGELLDGSGDSPPFADRVRDLARRKLPEVDELICRATAMRDLLKANLACECASADECLLFVSDGD